MSNRQKALQELQAAIGLLERAVLPARAAKPIKITPVTAVRPHTGTIADFAMKARTAIRLPSDKPMKRGESHPIPIRERLRVIRLSELAGKATGGK